MRTGLQFPDVRLVPTDAPRGVLGVTLNHVRLPEHHVAAPSGWGDIVAALRNVLFAYAPWFVRVTAVAETRAQLADVIPYLTSIFSSLYSDPLLAACLRSMLRNGDSVRNLARILWLLIEAGATGPAADRVDLSECPHFSTAGAISVVQRDPELLASAVRKQIVDEAWRAGAIRGGPPCLCLPVDLENSLTESADADALAAAEWRIVNAMSAVDPPFQVVAHSPSALGALRYALLALPVPPRVVASQELPPDAGLPTTVQV